VKPPYAYSLPRGTRAWYGGKEPPSTDALDLLELTDSETQLLYSLSPEGESGDYAKRMQALRQHLHTPALFGSWNTERSHMQFFKTLLDYAPHMPMRFQMLLALGTFKPSWRDDPQSFKQQIENFFAPFAGDYDALIFEHVAKQLPALWTPHPDGLLDHLLHRPAVFGQILGDRLDPDEGHALKIIGHTFADVDPATLRKLVQTQTIAYERKGEIRFNMAVCHTLAEWEEDPTQEFDLLDTLLLHELVEVALDESSGLAPLPAHIVATTFERCLKDSILAMAIEVFFIDWQPKAPVKEKTIAQTATVAQEVELSPAALDSIEDLFKESAREKPTPTQERTRVYNTEAKGNPDGKSVIVIDDSAMIRKIVSDVVIKLGHNIIEAADGKVGIPLIKSHKPDLIILDLFMAEKSGMETLKELRSDPNFKTTPIIMLTTEASQRIIREAMTWRVNDYIVKPVGSKKLRERIAAHLANR
jgi:two-component system, chemotaxis family, chemotaxis protein CheY